MLIRNLNAKLVNGSLGIVIGFSKGDPVVRFSQPYGRFVAMQMHRDDFGVQDYDGSSTLGRIQVPLICEGCSFATAPLPLLTRFVCRQWLGPSPSTSRRARVRLTAVRATLTRESADDPGKRTSHSPPARALRPRQDLRPWPSLCRPLARDQPRDDADCQPRPG
jgi:hypothetical protein